MKISKIHFTSLPIDDSNREAVLDWLADRKYFHIWFTSLILGSFVILTIFGKKPGFENLGEIFLSTSLILQLFSIICNLICIWSIPNWTFGVKTKAIDHTHRLRIELSILSWLGVISFVSGLTIGFIGNF